MSLSEKLSPAPLRGNEENSWANDTIIRRLPEIARRVLSENQLSHTARKNIETLIREIPYTPLPHINDGAPDVADWRNYLAPHLGQNWLDVPWYFAEAYFYRRIIEAVGYFSADDPHTADPFQLQKTRGLESKVSAIQSLAENLSRALAADSPWTQFSRLMHVSLWGNRADLSLWPAGEIGEHAITTDGAVPAENLLINDTTAVIAHLQALSASRRIDFLIDNAGFELVTDLALVDFLLSAELAETVTFHLKAHPTFVSDAMSKDVRQTLSFLTDTQNSAATAMAARLSDHLQRGSFELRQDFCWNSPLVFQAQPTALQKNLSDADLVISKGDANYRRLLGDCHWSFDASFAKIVSYFPAPVVALRTFKSELAAGIPSAVSANLSRQYPDWLTDGKRGVIQFSGI